MATMKSACIWTQFCTISVLILISIYSHGTHAVTYSEYACTSQYVELQCPDDKTISVTDADYAQYDVHCDDCCQPNGNGSDCTEAVADVRPDQWIIIQDTCNNVTECSVRNVGAEIRSCLSPYDADYMIVYFRCFPEDPTTTSTEAPTTPPSTTPLPTRRPQTTTPADDSGDDTPVAAIVGGVIGSILLVVLIILMIYLIYRLRKKPLKKRKVRIVKRPSNAQNAQRAPSNAQRAPPGAQRAPSNAQGRPTSTSQPAGSKSQPLNNQQPAKNEPIPPFVAYTNNAYEEEVEIVTGKTGPTKVHENSNKNARVSNGLAGAADIKGNTPTTTASDKNTYDNLVNETKAQNPTHLKSRPVSTAQNNAGAPERPKRPPVSRSSKPDMTSKRPDSQYYDIPKTESKKSVNKGENPEQRQRSETKSSSESGDNKYEDIGSVASDPEQAPPLEKKTIPPDTTYENVSMKK